MNTAWFTSNQGNNIHTAQDPPGGNIAHSDKLMMKFRIARDWKILKMFLMAICPTHSHVTLTSCWYFYIMFNGGTGKFVVTHFLGKYEATETSTSAWLDFWTPFTFESKDKAETFEIQPVASCLQVTQTVHSHTHSMTKCGPRQGHHSSVWRLQRPN